MAKKFKAAKAMGFQGIQFHDDDVVPNLDNSRMRRS